MCIRDRFYRHLLVHLGTHGSLMVRQIFANASSFVKKPATRSTLVVEIDKLDWYSAREEDLGNLYEGLLENRLVLASPPGPLSPQEMGPGGEVALVNDKGERKLSGSYYTPDFIVEYIVSQTLDPILDERSLRFSAALGRIADLRKKLHQALDKTTNQRLQAQLASAERDALEAFLGIKVCDPAMGSGHFLVNAVDHLTDGIIRRMQVYHDTHPSVPWDWNPVQRLIERVRREIEAEMARQGIAVDAARLDDTAPVSYTHLRAHETVLDLVCRLLLEKKTE